MPSDWIPPPPFEVRRDAEFAAAAQAAGRSVTPQAPPPSTKAKGVVVKVLANPDPLKERYLIQLPGDDPSKVVAGRRSSVMRELYQPIRVGDVVEYEMSPDLTTAWISYRYK